MEVIRPLQLGLDHHVLEHGRRFFFTVSLPLGVDLASGEAVLQSDLWESIIGELGERPLLDPGMPKPRGEWLVSGAFHAPGGRPVPSADVCARLGERSKTVRVHGPRSWQANGLPSPALPINTLPLDYGRAFGGPGYPLNPIGIGHGDGLLPAVEWPDRAVTSEKDTPEPAGLSYLDVAASQRQRYQGTYNEDYLKKWFPGHPEDMDWHLFMTTPTDQWWPGYFSGNEAFEITHMHPEQPLLRGRLPGYRCRCFAQVNGPERFRELPLNLDTVWLFPGVSTALLIWRGVVEVADPHAKDVEHLVAGYERQSDPARSLDHYREALNRRLQSDDELLNYFRTGDLIPPGATVAMALLMQRGLAPFEGSELDKNMENRLAAAKEEIDQQAQDIDRQMQEQMASADVASATEPLNLADKVNAPRAEPPERLQALHAEMERLIPGITAGDPAKLDLSDFSFDKLDELFAAVDRFSEEQGAEALAQVENMREQIETLKQEHPEEMAANAELLKPHPPEPAPLPRMDAAEISAQMAQSNDQLQQQFEQLRAQSSEGVSAEQLAELDTLSIASPEGALDEAENLFRENYRESAHHMETGALHHKVPLSQVRAELLALLAAGGSAARRDWAGLDLSGCDMSGCDLRDAYLEQADLSGACLAGADLRGAVLARANLEGADLRDARLQAANIGAVRAADADFSGAQMQEAKLSYGDFRRARFHGAQLAEAEWMEVKLQGADFTDCQLDDVVFDELDLSDADFSGAQMDVALLMRCRLERTRFLGASLSRSVWNECQGSDADFSGAALEQASFVPGEAGACFERARFHRAKLLRACFRDLALNEADFSQAEMEYAVLQGAQLRKTDFRQAGAYRAMFHESDLTRARLNYADLRETMFGDARLSGASFTGANLYGANFLRGTFGETDFSDANLDATLLQDWQPK